MGIAPEKTAYPQTVTSPYTSTPDGHQLWVQPLSFIQPRMIFLSLFSSKPLFLAQTRLRPGEAPSYCRHLLCGAPAAWDALSGGGRRWSFTAVRGKGPRLCLPIPCTCDSAALSPSRSRCQQIPAPGSAHCGLAQRMVVSSVTCDLQLPFSGNGPLSVSRAALTQYLSPLTQQSHVWL